jgi:D-glycero-alpha-D-manno-heptose-7-phosphate kinase
MLLVYTGISRDASELAGAQIAAIPGKADVLRRMQALVYAAADILLGTRDIAGFGDLLHETWELKRSISGRISTPLIDELYDTARRAGALGGKLLGAGGGGFVLIFVRPKERAKVLEALKNFLVVPFELESSGTRVVLYEPDRYSQFAHMRRDFVR